MSIDHARSDYGLEVDLHNPFARVVDRASDYDFNAEHIEDNVTRSGTVTWAAWGAECGESLNGQGSKNAALVKFAEQSKYSELIMPLEETIELRQRIGFQNNVGITGEVASKGHNLCKFKVTTPNANLYFPKGCRLRSLSFAADSNVAQNGIVQIGTWNNRNNNPNVDPSVIECNFNIGGNNVAIACNGRNLKVDNCAFSDGTGCTAAKVCWKGIEEGKGEFRKLRFINNQVHLGRSSRAVLITDQDMQFDDFLIQSNTLDIGCQLVKCNSKGGTLNINNNNWVCAEKAWNLGEGVVEFACRNIHGSMNNNVFNSKNRANGNRPDFLVRVTDFCTSFGLNINNNTFQQAKTGSYAVKVSTSGSGSAGQVKDNVIDNGDSNRIADKGVNAKGSTQVSGNSGQTRS